MCYVRNATDEQCTAIERGQSAMRSMSAASARPGEVLSIQAMAWAIEQQEVTEPITQLVLICLANYAGAHGENAFPSLSRLVRDTRLSERAIRMHLRKLEQLSLIRRGNAAVVEAYVKRSDRRPLCYDLIMSRGASDAGRESTGGILRPNGGHLVPERGAPHAPDPILKSVREPKSVFQKHEEEFRARFGRLPSDLAEKMRIKK